MRVLISLLRKKKVELPGKEGKLKMEKLQQLHDTVMELVSDDDKIDLIHLCAKAHPSEVTIGEHGIFECLDTLESAKSDVSCRGSFDLFVCVLDMAYQDVTFEHGSDG